MNFNKFTTHAKNRMKKRYGNTIIPIILYWFSIPSKDKRLWKIFNFKYIVDDGIVRTFMYGSGAMSRKLLKK